MKNTVFEWNKKDIEIFWDVYAKQKRTYLGDENSVKIFKIVRKYLPRTGVVLDIGMGSGTLLSLLHKNGYEGCGVDLSSRTIKMAKEKYPYGVFKLGDITSIPFPDVFFDVIFATEIIEHIPKKDNVKAINELLRCLKQSGILILSTPFNEDLEENYIFCPNCHVFSHKVQHQQSFNQEKIRALLVPYFNLLFCDTPYKLVLPSSVLKRFMKLGYAFIFGTKIERTTLLVVAKKKGFTVGE